MNHQNNRPDGYDCLINSDITKDGIRIDGHSYVTVVAFEDLDTHRTYTIDQCSRCDYPIVAWTDEDAGKIIRNYKYQKKTGG